MKEKQVQELLKYSNVILNGYSTTIQLCISDNKGEEYVDAYYDYDDDANDDRWEMYCNLLSIIYHYVIRFGCIPPIGTVLVSSLFNVYIVQLRIINHGTGIFIILAETNY